MEKKLIVLIIGLIIIISIAGFASLGGTKIFAPPDADQDGVIDEEDAFPNDPTQFADRDEDGYGDNPNGRTPDAFPDDKSEWIDTDKDGIGNNADKFPTDATQWADRDNDGYGDNPNGNNPDAFPDNRNEWKDTDHDSIGDNADIYDQGNGGIRVQIIKFIGDNYGESFPEAGTNDPFFKIMVYAYYPGKQTELVGEGQSSIFYDDVTIDYPFSYICDVNDDANKISVYISAIDEGGMFASDSIIDINSNIDSGEILQYFFPGSNNNVLSFTDDGKIDLQDERDGVIEYSIQVVGI